MRQFIVDEHTLRQLLYESHMYNILEIDGVDNWSWYMESYEQYCQEDGCETLEEVVEKDLNTNYKEVDV